MAANAPQATTRPATPSAAESTDGPVLNLINKRLRALRKKKTRIIQMEESLAQGKVLNKEQEETLKSKTVVFAQIDELEKLKQPLSAAVAEEHAVAVNKYVESEKDKEAARASGEEGYLVVEEVKEDQKEEEVEDDSDLVIGDLLKLIYFGSMFDVKEHHEFTSIMVTKEHERGSCLTYDYVTDDAVDVLGEKDLDFISQLGSYLMSRPMDSSLSHKDALERCVEHAKLWLANSEQPFGSDTSITYAGLRQKLNKIMASEYFTTTPEMKAPVDVAAAAAGNYASYQASSQGEGNVANYEQQDEGGNYQQDNDNEYNHADEGHKEEIATDHYAEQNQRDYIQSEEQNQKDSDQYVQRRGYQNHGYQNQRGGRGGGRRGSNGRGFRGGSRGGGPYQNGRNQYYDQPGNYYPRNSNGSRGRGGRGMGGRGYNQYTQNAHPAGDAGVAS